MAGSKFLSVKGGTSEKNKTRWYFALPLTTQHSSEGSVLVSRRIPERCGRAAVVVAVAVVVVSQSLLLVWRNQG